MIRGMSFVVALLSPEVGKRRVIRGPRYRPGTQNLSVVHAMRRSERFAGVIGRSPCAQNAMGCIFQLVVTHLREY